MQLSLRTDRMDQARVMLDRDNVIGETEEQCKAAMAAFDLHALNAALETAINLGLRNATVSS